MSDEPFDDDFYAQACEQHLPDGIGLSVEEIRALLAQKHNTLVAADDPILMMVTLLNAFLGEQQAQNDRLKDGMRRLLADKTDAYVTGVQTATDSLAQKLQSSSVEGMQKLFQGLQDSLNRFKSMMLFLTIVVTLSAILNVSVFILNSIR